MGDRTNDFPDYIPNSIGDISDDDYNNGVPIGISESTIDGSSGSMDNYPNSVSVNETFAIGSFIVFQLTGIGKGKVHSLPKGRVPDIFMTFPALTNDQRLNPVDLGTAKKPMTGYVLFRLDKGKILKPCLKWPRAFPTQLRKEAETLIKSACI